MTLKIVGVSICLALGVGIAVVADIIYHRIRS